MPRRKSAYRAALKEVPHLLRSPDRPVEIPPGAPATLEVGMGAGHFLVSRAKDDPGRRFVGLEIKEERTFQAAREVEKLGLTNVQFVVGEATRVQPAFPATAFDEFFVLFPDPWPRGRDFARRLTSVRYLTIFRRWLRPDARCTFRSDNANLFLDALGTIPAAGFRILTSSNNAPPGQTQTRYEIRFRAEGTAIHEITFVPETPAPIAGADPKPRDSR